MQYDSGVPADTGALAPQADLTAAEGLGEDEAALAAYLAKIDAAYEENPATAGETVSALSTAELERGRAYVREVFEQSDMGGIIAGASLARLEDRIIEGYFRSAEHQFPLPNPTAGERMAVVAVGGYGRGLLAPGSDVDLLFLTPYKRSSWHENTVETMLYALWDLNQKVGQATRSINECLSLAKSDMTIRTSLLETRFICGDRALYDEMRARLWSELFESTGPEFTAAKLEERTQRHQRSGGSRYMLEPNVKEGKGGLRDLHSLFWIAKYVYGVEDAGELSAHNVFTVGEARTFRKTEAFLWTVRFWLHYLTGRAQEQLIFDLQVQIAEKMGFQQDAGRMAVERFMRRYFMTAKDVGDLTRIFCAALEGQHLAPKAPTAGRLFGLFGFRDRDKGMHVDHGRIAVQNAEPFRADPLEMLRVFEAASRTGAPIHPNTLKAIRRNLGLVDSAMIRDPQANELFLNVLCNGKDPERVLRLMNECGLLGRFMPEFGRIVCMMQFNMYHHFTVDEHTIRAVGELARIERGESEDIAPFATSIMRGSINRRVLYVALLLHDIGKGRSEDHSILGARIAEDVCARLGLSDSECETVVWLVRSHLMMSDYAQKRDLSDRRTIEDFAVRVQSRERLKLLLVLTVCDIRAVGPDVWNGWKAQLLRTLYTETEAMITGGHDAAAGSRRERLEAAKDQLRAALHDWEDGVLTAFLERHYPPYWLGLDAETHEVHARMLAAAENDALAINVSADESRAATRLAICMSDHPGLFSRITGAVSLAGASILDARTFTTRDGAAIATLWLQDKDGEAYDDPSRLKRMDKVLRQVLSGEVRPREELQSRDRIKKRELSFTVPPDVTFDNSASESFTVIEVTGRDRLGLVHDLARVLTDSRVSIFSAVIATYGERAVDTFYVKDLFGHKIGNPSRQRAIEQALRAALTADS